MLDNIVNSVRRGAGRVQRRGEEVAQGARLRVEVFGLTRELDGLYARLGRSYHAGADPEVLAGIQDDLRRVDEEISARERLLRELDGAGAPSPGDLPESDRRPPALTLEATPVSGTASGTEPTVPDAVPRPGESGAPAASSQTLIARIIESREADEGSGGNR